MKSAPARRIEVSDSRIARSRSIHPFCAAAMIMLNSPLTWYAPNRHSRTGRRACRIMSRYGMRRLHHDHVRAFFQIQFDFAHRLPRVRRDPSGSCAGRQTAASIRPPRERAHRTPTRISPHRKGSECSHNPAPSSAFRIAATRPSIMSLGRTMSAPPRAWETARLGQPLRASCRCGHLVASTIYVTAMPVAGVLAVADIGHHQQLRYFRLHCANRPLHDAILGVGARRHLVFFLRNAEQHHPADTQLPACGGITSNSSTDSCALPGMALISRLTPSPVQINSGRTNWEGDRWVSRTSRLIGSFALRRRILCTGNAISSR